MNSKTVIVILLFLTSVCTPLNRQASALDREPDSEYLEEVGRELSAYSFNYKKSIRGKGNRDVMIRGRGQGQAVTRPNNQQSDLLRELLVVEDLQDFIELEVVVQHQY